VKLFDWLRTTPRDAQFPIPSAEAREFHRRVLQLNGGTWFSFETHLAALYRAVLRPGAIALDGGANIGQHTLQMISAVSPGGLVIAAEPVPELRAKLEAALRKNHVRPDSIKIVSAALSDQLGESEFYQVTNEEQHELSGLKNRHWIKPYPVKRIHVELTTIDSICAGLHRLDFLKLDVEGAEMNALRGGQRTVEKFRPIVSFEQDQFSPQYFGYTWQDLLDYFTSLQYEIYDLFGVLYDDRCMFHECAVWDFLALPAQTKAKSAVFKVLRDSMLQAGVQFKAAPDSPIPGRWNADSWTP
jgi:FkbM family methyltransferase